MADILISPHENPFYISYDPARADVVSIDGVLVTVDLLRYLFVAPDPEKCFSMVRNGDQVLGKVLR